ncbi:glycosyltransferase [Bradyrhizobium sp. LHD-71]|uniref:glycosyltransferase n=1 Tax=Bradyrhizobium sp. LHD-71 TaxID=3072141 RepID=UPI00280FA945|nr:glycosyltransferase [Bradyrhizobium sp. LHD-71]MDQ8728357.1 glycosyltransferase [Bradyrhizobium sp. LHD-71]
MQIETGGMTGDIIARYRVEWSDGSCYWSSSPVTSLMELMLNWQNVRRNRPLQFELVAARARIDRISLHCKISGKPGLAGLWCELLDASGQTIARGQVSAEDILASGGYPTIIDGVGLELVPGAKYFVRLSSADGNGANCISVQVMQTSPGRHELRQEFLGYSNRRTFVYREPSPGSDTAVKIVAICDSSRLDGAVVAALHRRFPSQRLTLVDQGELTRQWSLVAEADCALFVDVSPDGSGTAAYDSLCFELHRRGTLTLFFQSQKWPDLSNDPSLSYAGHLAVRQQLAKSHARRCHFVLADGEVPSLTKTIDQTAWRLDGSAEKSHVSEALMRRMLADIRGRRMPRVAIVSVLYNKADVIETFLDHAVRQSYPGEIIITLVNDVSPGGDAEIARNYASTLRRSGRNNRRIEVIDNPENAGNCASRNRGIAAVDADIVIVMDCDCLMNRDFVAAHVFEHWFEDVDAVIGPLNIETNGRDGPKLVSSLEASPGALKIEAEPQDPVQADGFLNCITRNFSVKRRHLTEPLFDVDFSYSSRPDSGFGWEDVEMGYRLYAKGATIRFTSLAFAVHCSHESSMPEHRKILGSMRNFARLFEKHAGLDLTARRWGTETYGRLADWAERAGLTPNADRLALDGYFSASRTRLEPLLAGYRRGARPLRILTYRWHVPHQYELYKLPHEFTLATGLGNGMVDAWQLDQRPLPANARLVPATAIDIRHYDVAILHFDENVLAPQLTNGVIPFVWGEPFQWLLAQNLPKVAVCHGTTQFVGQYGADPFRKTEFIVHEDERIRLVETLAAARVKVICNSHQAAHEWGFQDSTVIWQGFDPQEFPAGPHDRDILALEPDRYRPHYRGAWEHAIVEQRLDPGIRIGSARHPGAALEMRHTNAFATRQFRSYVDRIRRFTCYLNTTLRSPMPRARGEAMMTGVIPVCLRNHDVDMFIEQGVDGYYADTPEELADFLNYLFRDRSRTVPMAAAARRKALDVFNHDRYLASWTKVLQDAIG